MQKIEPESIDLMQKIEPESIDLMQKNRAREDRFGAKKKHSFGAKKTVREHRFDAPKIHINQVNQRNLLLQHLH